MFVHLQKLVEAGNKVNMSAAEIHGLTITSIHIGDTVTKLLY